MKRKTVDPLTRLANDYCDRYNESVGRKKYSYDRRTETIVSDTGTGMHFTRYLEQLIEQDSRHLRTR